MTIQKTILKPESVVAVLRKGGKVKEIPVIMRERNGGDDHQYPLKGQYII